MDNPILLNCNLVKIFTKLYSIYCKVSFSRNNIYIQY